MSRKRRRRKVGKHISLSATDADWEIVRSNAKRRGLSIARYLVELVERDASEEDAGLRHECPELALAKEEQRELLEAVREVRALMLEGECCIADYLTMDFPDYFVRRRRGFFTLFGLCRIDDEPVPTHFLLASRGASGSFRPACWGVA